MDEGKVIEQGTHDELLRLGGRYAELVAFQRSTSTDESSEDIAISSSLTQDHVANGLSKV